MTFRLSRRSWLQGVALATGATAVSALPASALPHHRRDGWVQGRLTGAEAVTDTLLAEGTGCVFGIPGAQENELWDTFKSRGLPYLLVTHEFSAACMADGYARSTGQPGVLCVVPGPGITNALTGLGEALLDSVPLVCIVGDIAQGEDYHPYQVHCLDSVALLKPVTKGVFEVRETAQIADTIRHAFALARCGEPGPTAVVIPFPLFIEVASFDSGPLAPCGVAFDSAAFSQAVTLLSDRRLRVGIYAGYGCMDYPDHLAAVAELLQAPVATSVSGKGVIRDDHPLSVGWGYGAHATRTADVIFQGETCRPRSHEVDCVLALGVKYSEVSTGFYGNPRKKHQIHVDANAQNLGQIIPADVCVHADAGVFLDQLLHHADYVRRPTDAALTERIRELKAEERADLAQSEAMHGIDPMCLIFALRRALPPEGMLFVDVTASEHLAAQGFPVCSPRTYFNPIDNQSMGWSIPAAIGAQRAFPHRPVATLTGDGCFLMSGLEISTAARAGLPVKFFILDDQVYHYMQILQDSAYKRTTATELARLDYRALAQGLGVAYAEITPGTPLDNAVQGVMAYPGPVLVRVHTDYTGRDIRWIEAVRGRYVDELSAGQKARFLARIGARSISPGPSD